MPSPLHRFPRPISLALGGRSAATPSFLLRCLHWDPRQGRGSLPFLSRKYFLKRKNLSTRTHTALPLVKEFSLHGNKIETENESVSARITSINEQEIRFDKLGWLRIILNSRNRHFFQSIYNLILLSLIVLGRYFAWFMEETGSRRLEIHLNIFAGRDSARGCETSE